MSVGGASRRRRYRVPTVVALAALLLLAPLVGTADAKTGILHRSDVHTADSLTGYLVQHDGQRAFWQAVSDVGGPLTWRVLAALVAVVLLTRRPRRGADAALIVVVMTGAAVISGTVKAAVARARPSVPHSIEHVAGGSFPSGHALTSAAAMGLLVVLTWPCLRARGHRLAALGVAVGAAVVTLLVGFSRLMLGVHYPTDVVGGWLFALLWLAVSIILVRASVALMQRRSRRG